MPTENIRQLLIQERDRLNRAIEVLQGPILRRGRPLNTAAVKATLAPRVGQKTPGPYRRSAQSPMLHKQFWATRKKQKSTKE